LRRRAIVENAALHATLDPVRIAIDTNCLIGALVNPSGACARIVQAWLDGDLEAVASEATVREAELVIGGRWLARMVGREKVEELLRNLRARTIWVEQPARITDLRLKDEGDLRMVETAVAGGARYVVTTDREFLSRRGYGAVEFVTPGELLGRLEGVLRR
jgi:putative PIN family toxin of toxin-antitoxin system